MSIESTTTIPAATVAGAAAVACLRASARGQYGFGRAWTIAMRRAFRLLGASAAAWTLGRLLWLLLTLLDGRQPRFPGLADALLLVAIPLAAVGMLAYPTSAVRALTRVRTLLDGLLIASSLLFVCWATVLGPVYRAAGGPVLPRAVGLAYPLGDIVTMTIAFSLLARTRGHCVPQLLLLTGATVVISLADAGFAYHIATGDDVPGVLISVGWLAGFLLLAVAALPSTPAELLRNDDSEAAFPLSWRRLALSYLPPAVACVTAATVQLTRGQLDTFLVFDGIAMALFVAARQVVTTVENRRLHRRLRDTVDRLFQREAELETALRREYASADRLRAMSEMKDTFLRAVSHDLRTPLTAMHGVAVTLERTKLSLPKEQALDLIRMMIEKTRKMDRLLGDLLDLNRMEEGILEPNRSITDVRALAHRVVDEVEQLRGWPIEIEADPVLAAVDSPKVERILENLLLNTTRHTPPGTQVWVRALTGERDLELIVEDAGPGVPAELAGTIFEPFRQGHPHSAPTHGRQGRGVGIGLSLVARFAELHGGRAWVTERTGGGACFHVLMPGCVRQLGDGDAAGRLDRLQRPGASSPAQPVLLPSARE
jgi:signal transduction histidine kinase